MEIVLVHPEIPNNTGSIGRLVLGLGLRLHIVRPIGFSLEEKGLRRAGLDYWPRVDLMVHDDWDACCDFLSPGSSPPVEDRMHFFSARQGTSLFDVAFEKDAVLVFGGESKGLPSAMLDAYARQCVRVPVSKEIRSLNLANTVCLAAYTAVVSAGMPLPT